MKVWIDLSNSPHPLLFEPVARRLGEMGHRVELTARDNAQTIELARQRWPDVSVVGGASPSSRVAKGRAVLARARELARWARARGPDVALSHGSYAQVVAARAVGVPAVTGMDYEHQPANHLSFRLARRVVLPRALRATRVRYQGATEPKARYYDGLKEELYLGEFEPDRGVVEGVFLEGRRDAPLVVARTPPSGALYHRSENRLFGDVIRRVAAEGGADCVVLARNPHQREAIEGLGLPRVVVPGAAVDARSLIHAADLVVGAGGTMTREAALLGVPTASVFAGRPAAVDTWLERRGALRRILSAAELPSPRRRERAPRAVAELRSRGSRLVEDFARTVEEVGTRVTRSAVPAGAHV
jgi:predicted glycosyltransferase